MFRSILILVLIVTYFDGAFAQPPERGPHGGKLQVSESGNVWFEYDGTQQTFVFYVLDAAFRVLPARVRVQTKHTVYEVEDPAPFKSKRRELRLLPTPDRQGYVGRLHLERSSAYRVSLKVVVNHSTSVERATIRVPQTP